MAVKKTSAPKRAATPKKTTTKKAAPKTTARRSPAKTTAPKTPAKKASTPTKLTGSPAKSRAGVSRSVAKKPSAPAAKTTTAAKTTAKKPEAAKNQDPATVKFPAPSANEKKALEGVRDMLGTDKLGGADKAFNYADRKPVILGLLKDKEGLKQEVETKLRSEGKGWQVGIAKKAIDGERGFIVDRARKTINKEVTTELAKEFNKGLAEGKVDPNTAKTPDNVDRNLTFAEMRQFEKDTAILEAMQKRLSEQMGANIHFPNGINQDAIEHLLQGKEGLPPGAKILGQ